MRTLRWLPMVAMIAALPLITGQSCPFFQQPGPSQTELTAEERAAIGSTLQAAAAIGQATGVAQAPVGFNDGSTQIGPGSVTLGECPAVTTTIDADAEEEVALRLSIDFGAAACSPEVFPGLACSGSATGTVNPFSNFIVLTFNSIGCSGNSLTGQAEVSFSPTLSGVTLNGTFDLGWVSTEGSVSLEGEGQVGYDRFVKTSTIGRFIGSMTNANGTYQIDLTDVVVSYQDNANLIPSGGVMTISGSDIRSLTVRFNADSPSTGQIEVSIAGGPFFAVDVGSL